MTSTLQPFDLKTSALSGRNLVEASAGTGKTYTIEGIFLRLLLEKQLPVDRILVVTFTEAATSELRERIRLKITTALHAFQSGNSSDDLITHLMGRVPDHTTGIQVLKSALARFDEAAISTIHGFCHRELLDNAFECGSCFEMSFIKDQRDLLLEIARDFWRRQLYESNEQWSAFFIDQFGSPEKMLWSFSDILSRPEAHILPDQKRDPEKPADPAPTALQVSLRFDDLRKAWPAVRDDIIQLLISYEGLNHRSYSRATVPKWAAQVDDFVRIGNPYLFPEKLDRFANEGIGEKMNAGVTGPSHPIFDLCSSLLEKGRELQIQLKLALLDFVSRELPARKQQQSLLSFDDLLKDLQAALNGPGGADLASQIRSRYQVALIDEFQDTDPIQFDIFNTVFNSPDQPLFFIGDPKQSIYSFRGADIFAYMEARETTDQAYTLNTNWRSDGDLIQAINTLFSFRNDPFVYSRIEFHTIAPGPESPDRGLTIKGQPDTPFQLWYLEDGEKPIPKTTAQARVATSVAGEVARLLNLSRQGQVLLPDRISGNPVSLKPEHIAILVRKNQEGEIIQQALAEAHVPSVLNTRATVFEDPIFREIVQLLHGISDATSERKVKRALSTGLIGINGEELLSLMSKEPRWEELLEEFQSYRNTWLEHGFFAMIRQLLAKRQIRVNLLRQERGERKLTNFLHGLELLQEAQNDQQLGMAGLLKWAERQMSMEGKGKEETEIRLETDDNAVRIMTVHASKGLEFPVVFCPYPWGVGKVRQVFFHDVRNVNNLTLDLGSENLALHKQQAEREALAEEIRLLYVALTRARNRCYMVWGNINKSAESAPAWLFHDGRTPAESLLPDLEKLADAAAGRINLIRMPENETAPYAGETVAEMELQRFRFKGFKTPDWGVSSFSGLSSRSSRNNENPDRDHLQHISPADDSPPIQDHVRNIFTLPKGANTGNCLHEIFEHLDFQETDPDKKAHLVEKTLQKYNFRDYWKPVALDLIERVLSTPLNLADGGSDTMILADLSRTKRLPEMEFYFPMNGISSKGMTDLIQPHLNLHTGVLLNETINRLVFKEIPGFMKGFIDLIFEHNGRYYILDWKTNHLGNLPEAYLPEHLEQYMISHSFVLQYMIYVVALHRMLKLKLANYRFQDHFGGVYYIFLRGIQGRSAPLTGIYHDNLAGGAGLVESLSGYFGDNTEGGR